MRVNPRIAAIQPSATLALNQKTKALIAAGKSIVNLTTGEPDFTTPERIRRAAKEAMDRGETHYTAVAGIAPLRDAVARAASAAYGRAYRAANVIVSNGAKQSLFNLFFAMLRPGDEVVLLAPYWVSYADMVAMNGGVPVIVEARVEDGFCPDPAAIERAIGPRTRAILLNSPSNPTGAVYPRAFLGSLVETLLRHPDVLVITDDIYGKLLYDGRPFESIAMDRRLPDDRVIVVDGASKTFAMTGWRIGWTIAPEPWVALMDKIQSQTTSNPSSVSQWAALAALEGGADDAEAMRREFERRRDAMARALTDMRWPHHRPGGAFYFFPDARAYLGKSCGARRIADDAALCEYLLEEAGVSTVPGSAFGAPGFVRLSFAATMDELAEGAKRLAEGLGRLR